VEAYLKNLREAVGKGPFLKELNSYCERFKMPAAQLYGVKREDLVEVVDDMGGVFLEEVYGGSVVPNPFPHLFLPPA
jgi:peroxiredoxin family protein